eukprot:504946-Pelagomonas_calceolata.AAC.3
MQAYIALQQLKLCTHTGVSPAVRRRCAEGDALANAKLQPEKGKQQKSHTLALAASWMPETPGLLRITCML